MSYRCSLCNKKSIHGSSRTHKRGVAGGQWKKRAPATKRLFSPNLHFVTMPVKGKMMRVKACAKCIKRLKFDLQKSKKAGLEFQPNIRMSASNPS